MTSFTRTAADDDVSQDPPLRNSPSSNEPRNTRRASLAIASGVLVVLYLGFVFHFATNVPGGDDWNVVPLIHSALHGHLTLSGPNGLWAQHLESRIFFPNLLFVLSGFIDHYDLRTILFLSAVIYIVSYFILLRLYRVYDGRPLTAVPLCGSRPHLISFADVKNVLWAFQVAWFMVTFCFIILIYLLSVSSLNRSIIFRLPCLLR